jgi:hypothetical protein
MRKDGVCLVNNVLSPEQADTCAALDGKLRASGAAWLCARGD